VPTRHRHPPSLADAPASRLPPGLRSSPTASWPRRRPVFLPAAPILRLPL
jgi:hypothetical protein